MPTVTARILQIRTALDTFKCVHDVVLRVQLTLGVRRHGVGKNSRPRLGRGGLEIDITADALKQYFPLLRYPISPLHLVCTRFSPPPALTRSKLVSHYTDTLFMYSP